MEVQSNQTKEQKIEIITNYLLGEAHNIKENYESCITDYDDGWKIELALYYAQYKSSIEKIVDEYYYHPTLFEVTKLLLKDIIEVYHFSCGNGDTEIPFNIINQVSAMYPDGEDYCKVLYFPSLNVKSRHLMDEVVNEMDGDFSIINDGSSVTYAYDTSVTIGFPVVWDVLGIYEKFCT